MLAHATNDFEIPVRYSRALFDLLLEPLLPPFLSLPSSPDKMRSDDWNKYNATVEARGEKRAEVVNIQDMEAFGRILSFWRNIEGGEPVPVVYTESRWGAHNEIASQETITDVIGRTFKLL